MTQPAVDDLAFLFLFQEYIFDFNAESAIGETDRFWHAVLTPVINRQIFSKRKHEATSYYTSRFINFRYTNPTRLRTFIDIAFH